MAKNNTVPHKPQMTMYITITTMLLQHNTSNTPALIWVKFLNFLMGLQDTIWLVRQCNSQQSLFRHFSPRLQTLLCSPLQSEVTLSTDGRLGREGGQYGWSWRKSGRVGEWESGRVGEKVEGEGKRFDLQLKGQQSYTPMSRAISPCVGPGEGIGWSKLLDTKLPWPLTPCNGIRSGQSHSYMYTITFPAHIYTVTFPTHIYTVTFPAHTIDQTYSSRVQYLVARQIHSWAL